MEDLERGLTGLVQRYLDEGFGRPHPMPKGAKGPRITGWQNPEKQFRLTDFGETDNVGTSLIGDLVDVDLDCPEAVDLAPSWLPATGRIHGRASKPRSHYYYRAAGVTSYKFTDIPVLDPATGRKASKTILELRAGHKHQTMLPPSRHPSGERVEWADPLGDPAPWEADAAWCAARTIATIVLIGWHWSRGNRHDAALALGGFLCSRQVPLDQAERLTQQAMAIARDEELDDRLRCIRESYASFAANRPTTGLPKLKECLGDEVAHRLSDWYKVSTATIDGEFRLTEAGDADAFAGYGRDVIRFDHIRELWLVIHKETGIWIPDGEDQLTEMMKSFMRFQQGAVNDPARAVTDRKHAFVWYLKGESRSRLANALHLARSVRPISNNGEDWDLDPFLLGCQNGVVDLRTGDLRPALPEEHVSKRVRVAYNPDALCPLWLQTLADVFAPGPEFDETESTEILAYLQRAIGYSLTGDCREECCFFAWGTGRNGKGTIMNTIGWLMGDYKDDMPASTLEKARFGAGIPSDVAKLHQKRFVTSSEANEFQLNEARLKSLTGRDPMTARFLHKDFFTFQPVCKIWLATNNKPKITGQDEGIWSRIHLIPFLRSFVGRENFKLKDQLIEELPGILTWAVEGVRLWLERGLDAPKTVRSATQDYRHESNPISPFVEACCVVDPKCHVQAGHVFKAYQDWFRAMGDERFMLSDKGFYKAMKLRFESQEKRVPGANRVSMFFFGVGLRDDRSDEPVEKMPF